MPRKTLTPKQHKFCECIVKGMNQSDSYREAYPTSKKWRLTSVNIEASKLMSNTNILLMIDELRKEVTEDIKYDVNKQFKELCEMKEKALKDGNIVSALKAVELKGKLFGLYTDKHQFTEPIKTDIKIKFVE